ncbi:hypothetical protein VHUM_02434 [Vanrija humicola]|uniref:30S ribosomal protein S13 n=1 Tax=Vanrija humicola TaxID=5417 RepID=A0A7D8YZD0_VANHU|nr:hypothetical protein VHUM_02434 [Vanrija humicola]
MHLLGHHLPEHNLLRIALTAFYGISHATAPRVLARLSIPADAKVSSLTETQITALSAYLSAPAASTPPSKIVLAAPGKAADAAAAKKAAAEGPVDDPLNAIKIEVDLRRQRQADILHHRHIGTYRGRRHAMGLPVRGQTTQNNARTARRLNRMPTAKFSTSTHVEFDAPVPQPPSQILRMLGMQ